MADFDSHKQQYKTENTKRKRQIQTHTHTHTHTQRHTIDRA